jgi:hypothetical protein
LERGLREIANRSRAAVVTIFYYSISLDGGHRVVLDTENHPLPALVRRLPPIYRSASALLGAFGGAMEAYRRELGKTPYFALQDKNLQYHTATIEKGQVIDIAG